MLIFRPTRRSPGAPFEGSVHQVNDLLPPRHASVAMPAIDAALTPKAHVVAGACSSNVRGPPQSGAQARSRGESDSTQTAKSRVPAPNVAVDGSSSATH